MAVLFDPTDEFVSSVLHRAKFEGEISLPDVEAIVEGGIEARGSIPEDDIADTIEALARMGIEIAHDLTQEQRDEEMYCAIKEWVDQGNMVPSLTGAAWASLGRVTERRKRGEPEPSPEEVAERYAPSVSNRQVGACLPGLLRHRHVRAGAELQGPVLLTAARAESNSGDHRRKYDHALHVHGLLS